MILKKQTVWLLTMLSLIIVLSVYYIQMDSGQSQPASSENMEENFAVDEESEGDFELEWLEDDSITFVEVEDAEEVVGSQGFAAGVPAGEMFDTIRLQRQDARGKLHEEYKSMIISTETEPAIQVEALEKIENLQALSQKEEMVETIIRSRGYEDALVMADGHQVNIYVKSEELSHSEAAELNKLAYEHLGIDQIRVGYHQEN